MTDVAAIIEDLRAEGDELDRLVAGLPEAGWATPTPAEGWTIAHQIAHLAWTDQQAITAATDPAAFEKIRKAAEADPQGYVDAGAALRDRLLERWRDGRTLLAEVLEEVPEGTRLPWFGPPMGAASMATARIMETWAHGQDVADALGAERPVTHRLRHVAHLGVRTRDFAFRNRGLAPPREEFSVVLTAPGGALWAWGPPDAAQSVTGPALDFCLLVTQRRSRAGLAVTATGEDAGNWLEIAQAFAGPPGPGRSEQA